MNRTLLIYIGIIATVIISSVGLVFVPDAQLFALEPVRLESGEQRPLAPAGAIAMGREVYMDLGCIYCHSQQVRPEGFGSDLERGWGSRRSVPRDYIHDRPHLLGTMRTGPDLHNIGLRQPSEDWHYRHFYEPTLTSPGSTMPPHRFLFRRVRIEPGAQPPLDAIEMPEGYLAANEYLVPTDRARHLVAYLLNLNFSYDEPETR